MSRPKIFDLIKRVKELENQNSRFILNNSSICNGASKTFELEPLKQYLIVTTQYGQGNVYESAARIAILTTAENPTKTSGITNVVSDISGIITVEFIDALTIKITALANKWTITSITKL